MKSVPRWGLLSAATAPVVLIGGWTVAAARQTGGFDSVTGTISALAAHGATDRWLMTSALVVLGCCHVTTAAALRPAGRTGRVLLALGGVATIGVAAFPLPEVGSSTVHKVFAGLAFGALAVWPLGAAVRGCGVPWALRPRTSAVASGGLLGLVGWFVIAQQQGAAVGLSERAAAGAQALWPLAVVLALTRTPTPQPPFRHLGPFMPLDRGLATLIGAFDIGEAAGGATS